MSNRVHAAAAALLLALLAARPACAEGEGVEIHRAEHQTYTRLVFVLPNAEPFSMSRDGSTVVLGFAGAGMVPGAQAGGRLRSVIGGAGAVSITPQPGKTCRVSQQGPRVFVDVLDSPTEAAAAPFFLTDPSPAAAADPEKAVMKRTLFAAVRLPRPSSRQALRIIPTGQVSAAPVPVQEAPLPPPASPEAPSPPQSVQPSADASTASSANAPILSGLAGAEFAAALLPADEDFPNGAVLLPFGADVGAASFRRGGEGHVVFDTAQPVDLGALRNDPVYGGLAVALLPAGTHLHIVLPAAAQLRLVRAADGWRVGVVPEQPARPPITARPGPGVLKLLAALPGRAIVLDDPATGGRLLAATQRGQGQPWMAAYTTAEFAILPSWQGLLVQPASDRTVLNVVPEGFSLSADGQPPLSVPSAQGGVDGAGSVVMTRRFDLPPIGDALWRGRLKQAWQDAAAAPKLDRFGPRLRAAQAMVALGLDAEAGTMLKAAQADDPARATDLDVAALSALADWLAGRSDPAEIARLADPGLTGTDEIALWRALLQADASDPAARAGLVAATWKLALTYPASLRRSLLPPMAEILAHGGKTDSLRALLEAFPDKVLAFDRAALLARDGKTDEALAAYKQIAGGADRQQSSRARRAATELAFATHKIDGKTAAQQLGQQLYAWRGAPQELDLRMRLASLQGQVGQWRDGLALLRETEPLYPDAHDNLHAAERGLVGDLIKGSAADRMAPLDLVALAEECADLFAEGGGDAKLAPVLAAKLQALDLPDRAEPVLQHILDRTVDPGSKAEVGLRLAELRLDLHGGAAALATLDASEAADLPAPIAAERVLLRAKATAKNGDTDSAIHLLEGQATAQAVGLRARLLEQKHDWPAAEAALKTYMGLAIPANGALDAAQQNVIVHVASLASQAGDAAGLQLLKAHQGTRLSPGPEAQLFQLLTETPVHGVDDLTRAGQELKLARATPSALARLKDR